MRHCPEIIKYNCYQSMVRPIVEYASTVWDPHTTMNINKVEAIQRATARFCLNDFARYSSVTNMLTALNLPSLKSRRNRAKVIMMYKIVNDMIGIPRDYFTPCYPQVRKGSIL